METAKKVQGSNKKIAAGFCALRDKAGNWICHTVAMNQKKQFAVDQDLSFHPCEKIQNDLAANKDQIMMPYYENGHTAYVLDTSKVQIDGLVTEQSDTFTAARQQTAALQKNLH